MEWETTFKYTFWIGYIKIRLVKNKKILNIVIDFIGMIVFIVCIISILDKVYGIELYKE